MIVKEKFTLLKNVSNILNVSSSVIKKESIENGPRKLFVSIKLLEDRINHFTKNKIFDLLENKIERKRIHVVTFKNYPLHVGYNKSSKSIIINLSAFDTDDISRIDTKNLYACMVYGICFSEIVSGKHKISTNNFSPIVNYLLSIFIRLFGKEFGLLGIYATEIGKLKFLISCYVLSSFFGESGKSLYSKSSTVSFFNYRDIEDDLNKIDFSNIEEFIKSLSDFKVMPGMDRYRFTSKVLRFLSINFIPAIEDLARFISVITTSDISGSNIVPTFISKYNETEFSKLLTISKLIFK